MLNLEKMWTFLDLLIFFGKWKYSLYEGVVIESCLLIFFINSFLDDSHEDIPHRSKEFIQTSSFQNSSKEYY